MGFLTGLSLRAWGIIALVIGLAVGYGVWQHTKQQVVELKNTVNQQAGKIAVQKDAIEVGKKVDTINETTQVATQKVIKTTITKHEAIRTKVQEKEAVIEDHYADTPVTIESIEQKQDALSTTRIDGLWEAYCAAAPTATQCQPQGEPHA